MRKRITESVGVLVLTTVEIGLLVVLAFLVDLGYQIAV